VLEASGGEVNSSAVTKGTDAATAKTSVIKTNDDGVKKLSKEKVLTALSQKDKNVSSNKGSEKKSQAPQSKSLIPLVTGEYPTTAMQTAFAGPLAVILVDTQGKRTLLLPNRSTPDTYFEKQKPIAMLKEEAILRQIPDGLHYIMIVASEQRLVLGAVTKEKKDISALESDAIMMQVLDDLRAGHYGQFVFRMMPIYK
jgi:hypothetical protein